MSIHFEQKNFPHMSVRLTSQPVKVDEIQRNFPKNKVEVRWWVIFPNALLRIFPTNPTHSCSSLAQLGLKYYELVFSVEPNNRNCTGLLSNQLSATSSPQWSLLVTTDSKGALYESHFNFNQNRLRWLKSIHFKMTVADVIWKMPTIFKEMRIVQRCS